MKMMQWVFHQFAMVFLPFMPPPKNEKKKNKKQKNPHLEYFVNADYFPVTMDRSWRTAYYSIYTIL